MFEAVADELRGQGRRPFVVAGSSVPLGVLGYVEASVELQHQLQRLEIEPAAVFVTSLGVTHAGLELGARLLGQEHDVVGFAYQPAEREQAEATVRELADGAAALLGLPPAELRVRSDVGDGGAGYGVPTERSQAALLLAARTDALLLDPTYTAKGFAGLLRWIDEGRVPEGASIVFVHTGGLPGLFA